MSRDVHTFDQRSSQRIDRTVRRSEATLQPRPPGARRRALVGGGGGEHFAIIRGTTTTAVGPTDAAFRIQNVTVWEENGRTPAEPVNVAQPPGGAVTLSLGEAVWAIYRQGHTTHDYGTGVEDVDWAMLDFASANEVPALKYFELTATKTLAQATATAKWLDHAGNLVGSNITLHDPDLRFAGQVANYVGTERGFRGYAILRADDAETDPGAARYEIVALERFAELVEVTFAGSPTNEWQLAAGQFVGDEWNHRRPVADGAALGVTDTIGHFPNGPSDGDQALARLDDPDSAPPGYTLVAREHEDRFFAVDATDDSPNTFLAKAFDTSPSSGATTPRFVNFEIDAGPPRKFRGWLEVDDLLGGGGGGDTVAAGCGITITGSDPKVIGFDPTAAAGAGLEADTGEGACALDVQIGCGLEFDGDDAIAVNPTALAGEGLVPITSTGNCRLDVNPGCGIEVVDDQVQVKASDLAGFGLNVSGDCTLNVSLGVGCGLDFAGETIFFDSTQVAGAGLVPGTGCSVDVNPGCGITIANDAVNVNNSDLAGSGLVPEGNCALGVDRNVTVRSVTGCSLGIEGSQLVLRIQYDEYEVYGVQTGSGETSCAVDTTDCEA